MIPNNDLSFQLWSSARAADSLDTQLGLLKRLGYTDVQPYHSQYADPEGMKRLLDAHGLTAKTGHFDLSIFENDFGLVVRAAHTLGMTLVVAPYVQPADRPTDAAGWQAIGADLRRYERLCRAEGLAFAWHNHEFEMLPLPDGSRPIQHLLGDDLLWEIDVAWIARADLDPLPWIEAYAGRIPAIHVKDIAPPAAVVVEDGWADVGHGTLDWPACWNASVAAGAQLMVAEHDAPDDWARFAARSIESMRRLGGSA